MHLSINDDDSLENRNVLTGRSSLLAAQLNDLKTTADTRGAAKDALHDLLTAKEEKIRATKRLQFELRTRVAGIDSIRSEIEGKIKTLSLNEESKRALEHFLDNCRRPDCGLFLSSSESYAKNLLYLKDQIKDLESNSTRAEFQLEEIASRLLSEEDERDLILSKIKKNPEHSATDTLIDAVQSLTKQLMDIEQKRAAIQILSEERRKYIQFDNDRSSLQDRIAMLTNNARSDLDFNKLRLKVRDYLVRWMGIIHVLTVSRDVEIDLNFKFTFGNESLDVFTGSGRSRLVLAIHAALFEVYFENVNNPFRFLILDTPKQHELKGEDLANYLDELQMVCDKWGGQIVISSTEYRHELEEDDMEWRPEYLGVEQLMYLGSSNRIA